MLTIRHRTASGRLDSMWEFDAERKIVEVVFRLGAAEPTSVRVPVCSPERPVVDHYVVLRRDETTFALLASRFEVVLTEFAPGVMTPLLLPQAYPLHPLLTRGDQILLTSAPPDVARELAEL